MNKQDHSNDWFAPSDLRKIQDATGESGLSAFIDRSHALKNIHFIAGLSQIFLGLSVITVSAFGFVQPLWLSLILTIISSGVTMIGCYLVYMTISKSYDSNALLRNAMKRVMKSKN